MSNILCPYYHGCQKENCSHCAVYAAYLKSELTYLNTNRNKKDFDLENHFAGGL